MITEEIRLARRAGLGGSDIAGIIPCEGTKTGTLSPWATQVQVWDSKVGPDAGDRGETESMWWGSYDEDGVARRFTQMTGKRTVNHNFMIKDGCLIANLDRLIIPEGQKIAAHCGVIRTDEIFEAKTAGEEWPAADPVAVLPNGFKILDGASGIPPYYVTQVQHYLGRVPTARRCYVAVKMTIPCGHFCRTDFRAYVLERDDEVIAAQDAYAREWWERHVVGGVKPEAVCESDCRIIWRRSRPLTSVSLTSTAFRAWHDLKAAKEAAKAAEEAVEAAELAIKREMKDRESLVAPDGKTVLATWKSAKDRTVSTTDWEKLARDKGVTDGEIAAATTTVVKPGSRTFLAKFTDKVVEAAKAIDEATLPAPANAVEDAKGGANDVAATVAA